MSWIKHLEHGTVKLIATLKGRRFCIWSGVFFLVIREATISCSIIIKSWIYMFQLHLLHLKHFGWEEFLKILVKNMRPLKIKLAIAKEKNHTFHHRTKHIAIRHSFIRDAIEEEEKNFAIERNTRSSTAHEGWECYSYCAMK